MEGVERTCMTQGCLGRQKSQFWGSLGILRERNNIAMNASFTVDGRNPKQPPGMYPKPCK